MRNMKRTKTFSSSATNRTLREIFFESDGTYLLKLIVYILLATFWVKFGQPFIVGSFVLKGLPAGLLVSLLLIRVVESHQIDRKIIYAAVVTVGIVTSFLPAAIML